MTELKNTIYEEIEVERRRQAEKGWTHEHDDEHESSELAEAAAAYCLSAANMNISWGVWPFNSNSFKPTTSRRDLIKAAALVIAEIERLDRETQARNKAND